MGRAMDEYFERTRRPRDKQKIALAMLPDDASHAAQRERLRQRGIMAHPKVQNGIAYDLAVFLATETDMSIQEAHATLDKAQAPDPSKVHLSRRAAPAPPRENIAAPQRQREDQAHYDRIRAEVAAANTKAEQEYFARNGIVDRRSPAEKQRDNSFASLAQSCMASGGMDDYETRSLNQLNHRPAEDYELNSRDAADLVALGFGSSSSDESLFAAGAQSAARILGKNAPQSAPGHSPVIASRPPVAIDRDLFAQGAQAARKLLSVQPVRDEINAELARKFAEQRQNRSQPK